MRVAIIEGYLIEIGFVFWEKNQDKMTMGESIKMLYKILDECEIEVL